MFSGGRILILEFTKDGFLMEEYLFRSSLVMVFWWKNTYIGVHQRLFSCGRILIFEYMVFC